MPSYSLVEQCFMAIQQNASCLRLQIGDKIIAVNAATGVKGYLDCFLNYAQNLREFARSFLS